MKLKIFILFVLVIFLITENSYSVTSVASNKRKNIKIIKRANKKIVSNKETKCNINIQTTIPYTIEELQKFFPDTVLNAIASPPSTGRRDGKLNQITTCAIEYPLSGRCFFTITLTDYGSYDNIPSNELRDYLVLPKASDKSTVAYKIPCGDGYYMWHDKSNNGEISFLYCYRFVLKFEILNWDNSLPKLEEFVKFFNLNKLLEDSKNRLNR
ncbi:MAG: hypothetical protein EPN82_07435 [Bacteroidetes bacterium]|nr:MAG: hypothetical protein EPN82_07435 [Bacteroidota bacterium]